MRGKICDVISSLLSLEFWQHQWMVNAYGNTCFNQPFQRGFISKVRWCGPDTLGSTNGALSRSRSPCSDECEPGPETLQIQRDVIGEIQQYEWPKNPQNSKEFYRWCAACNVRSESSTDMLWSTIGALSLHQKSPSPCTNGFIGILGNVRVWPRNPQEVKFGNMILVLKS